MSLETTSVTHVTRVLVIGPTPPPTHGVSAMIRHLLNGLDTREFRVFHLDTSDRRGIQHVDKPDLQDVALFIGQWFRLLYMLLRHRPQLVYLPISQTTIGVLRDSFFIAPAMLFRRQVVCHLHGSNFRVWFDSAPWWVRAWLRLVLARISRMIVLAPRFMPLLDGLCPADRVVVVPNGLPDPIAGGPPKNHDESAGLQILYVGSLSTQKGVVVLVKAAAKVLSVVPSAEFVIAGNWTDPAGQRRVEALIQEFDISKKIRFVGEVDAEQKETLFAKSAVFVFPGLQQEGQPLVVLEAMSHSIPLVFTDRGCIRETVGENVAGLQARIGDPGDLAEKILTLISDTAARQRLGRAARARFLEHFCLAMHLQGMANVLRKVAHRNGSPAQHPSDRTSGSPRQTAP